MKRIPARALLLGAVLSLAAGSALSCSTGTQAQVTPDPSGVRSSLSTSASAVPSASSATPQPSPSASATPRAAKKDAPNVVVILTDDQRDGTLDEMPKVESLLVSKGINFTNAQSPTSTCCPARASLYTGNLAKTTGVWTNWPPYGGFEAFHRNGDERRSLAVRMRNAGYQTALSGKYLNDYAYPRVRIAETGDKDYVPPGWDSWWSFGMPNDNSITADQGYFDYYTIDRPSPTSQAQYTWHAHSKQDYSTDVFGDRAVDFINGAAPGKPLFLVYAPFGPHAPYVPAPKYSRQKFTIGPIPGVGDTTGKPPWVTDRKPVRQHAGANLARKQARCLSSVDDNVERIVTALQQQKRLNNTLLVFLSDNGLTWGEFNILGEKNYPYTTDIPLVARWDKAPAGSALSRPGTADDRLVSITDVTMTILKAAGASTTGVQDGMDLSQPSASRSDLLISAWRNRGGPGSMPAYCGIRTPSWLYVRYSPGFEELYDLRRDPNFLTNLASKAALGSTLQHMRSKIRVQCDPAPPGYRWNTAGG